MFKNKCGEEISCFLKCHIVGVNVQACACTVQRERSRGEMFWAVCFTFARESMSKCFVFNIVTVCFDNLNTGGLRLSKNKNKSIRSTRQRYYISGVQTALMDLKS